MTAPPPFDPGSIETFRVVDWDFDEPSRELRLRYALDDAERFEERVVFETPTPGTTHLGTGFEQAVGHLHVAAGVSYFKTAAPPTVLVESAALDGAGRHVHRLLYDDGLREFAVSNGRRVPLDVVIEAADPPAGARVGPGRPSRPGTGAPPRRPLVPVGGGKDSMVLVEALRPLDPLLFAVNPRPLVGDLVAASGLELITVRRHLDPRLHELNALGAMNGHVPVTAIVSLVAVVGSYLYGYDAIAMAIERSASEETSVVDGVPVNHQFSKSRTFETALSDLLAGSVAGAPLYASALRPYSELAIARAFAGMDRYHRLVVSCNGAFRLDAAPGTRWCGACPKCRFVGLVLAPFLGRAEVAAIIGRDLFADPAQVEGFAALLSSDDKPYECVGERRESAAAVTLLAGSEEWRTSPVVRALAPVAAAMLPEGGADDVLRPAPDLAYPDPVVAELVRRVLEPDAVVP